MEPERALLSREELRTKFGVVNYLVFLAMLLVSAAIGAYFWWRGQRSTGSTMLDHVYGQVSEAAASFYPGYGKMMHPGCFQSAHRLDHVTITHKTTLFNIHHFPCF